MDPANLHSRSWLTMAYLGLGRHEDALRIAEEAHAASRNSPAFRPLVAFVYRAMGRVDEAREIILDRLGAPDINPFGRALLYLMIDDREQCYAWLNRGVDERGDQLHSLRTSPFFASARGDPGFDAVLQRLRLGTGGT
jgi:hypothetical protein